MSSKTLPEKLVDLAELQKFIRQDLPWSSSTGPSMEDFGLSFWCTGSLPTDTDWKPFTFRGTGWKGQYNDQQISKVQAQIISQLVVRFNVREMVWPHQVIWVQNSDKRKSHTEHYAKFYFDWEMNVHGAPYWYLHGHASYTPGGALGDPFVWNIGLADYRHPVVAGKIKHRACRLIRGFFTDAVTMASLPITTVCRSKYNANKKAVTDILADVYGTNWKAAQKDYENYFNDDFDQDLSYAGIGSSAQNNLFYDDSNNYIDSNKLNHEISYGDFNGIHMEQGLYLNVIIGILGIILIVTVFAWICGLISGLVGTHFINKIKSNYKKKNNDDVVDVEIQ